MRIKRYEAKDIASALQLIKSELGPEAIILSTKKIMKAGSSAGEKRTLVEVVAGIDFEPQGNIAGRGTAEKRSFFSFPKHSDLQLKEITALKAEVLSLKSILQTVVNASSKPAKDGLLGEITAYLDSIGLERSLIYSLIAGLAAEAGESEEAAVHIKDLISERLLDQIMLDNFFHFENGEPLVWALVGPTGVGKTTTAVKLAAQFALGQGKKVVLISVDNYRIGASEQLRAYARILGLPCLIILKPEELSKAIDLNRDKDLIIIDTAGQNQHSKGNMAELAAFIQCHTAIEAKLVLSAGTQNGDMADIFSKYKTLPVRSCIFSKIDESRFYGPIFNQAVRFRLPVSYLTTGQNVPEDIEMASTTSLIHLLWRRLGNN